MATNIKPIVARSGACGILALAFLASTPARADPTAIGLMIVGLVENAAAAGATIAATSIFGITTVGAVAGSIITTAIGRGLYLERRT